MNKPLRGSTCKPDHIMISINGDAHTSMTVTWRTCIDVENGYAEYHEKGSDKIMRADAKTDVFKSDIDISNMFWANMIGLKPNTEYLYTCGDDKNRSEEYCFRTEPENLTKFKFICVSDQQCGEPHDLPDYSSFNTFVKTVLKDHPDTRFILTGGDNTDCGQHEVQWNGAFCGLTGIVEHLPFMMTLGNHDNRGFKDYDKCIGRYYSEPAEFFGKQFKGSYPSNGPKDWKTENYSFDYGNIHFVVFGVNGPDDVNEWAKKDIDSSDKTWKIGSYHFPIYYSICEGANYDAYPMMRECVEKLDLMFSGHEHNFSRSFPIKGENMYDRPSQGTIHYMLGNSNKNPPGSHTLQKVWHSAFFAHDEERCMVAVVEVDGEKITLTSYLDDGRIVDKCVIDKTKDEVQPYAASPIFRYTRMMFKGADMGLCQATTPAENKGGIWYVPFAVMVGYFGGEVKKTKNQVYLNAYGCNATFTQGSNIAKTDKGDVKLIAEVFRGERGQLYIPADDCAKIFNMRCAYADRNNFINFEIETEDKLITEQP